MGNYVIQRPESVGFMTTASAYALGTSASALSASSGFRDLGSVREFSFVESTETLYATSTMYNDANVASLRSGWTGEITILAEEITASATALAVGLTASGTNYYNDHTSTTPTDIAIIAEPFYIDGSAYTLVITKAHFGQGAEWKMAKEQRLLEIKGTAMVDTDASAGKKGYQLFKQ